MTTKDLGQKIRASRKQAGMTQAELAMVSGTAARFISDLENGKATCQVGKVLIVLQNLGLKVVFISGNEEN